MIRLSFRQSMLAGFLLIASCSVGRPCAAGSSSSSLSTQSRRSGEHVLQLSGSIQELADRTVDLERSARQFVVLNEATLLERFDDAPRACPGGGQRLESIPGEALGTLTRDWRAAAEQLSAGPAPIGACRSNCYRF
jgi:two-component system sensor histidine kinase GlrK